MEAIFEIQNLTFRYPAGKKNALENISFTVEAGQFLLLFGASASGKSTLLRHLKFLTAPFGERTGKILYKGEELSSVPSQRLVSEIGFVFQNPDTQMFCERVFDELAFGLSQIGLERSEIMRRVGETAAFFGIANLLDRSVDTLSGGQKQLVNLASVTVLRPSVILLDEPTAMLDPVAAANFYAMLYRLNREQGITVILCEHRCEEALLLSDSVLFMEEGRAAVRGPVQQVLKDMWEDPARRRYLPVPLQVLRQQGMLSDGDWPLRVSSLRELFARCKGLSPKAPSTAPLSKKEKTLEAKGLCFRYEKKMPDILRDVSFACHKGEIFALVGGNGSGKTTLLKVLAGILRADCGKVKKEKNAVYLPQNVGLLFLKDTLEADFRFQLSMDGAPGTDLSDPLFGISVAAGSQSVGPERRGITENGFSEGAFETAGNFTFGRACKRTGCILPPGIGRNSAGACKGGKDRSSCNA